MTLTDGRQIVGRCDRDSKLMFAAAVAGRVVQMLCLNCDLIGVPE